MLTRAVDTRLPAAIEKAPLTLTHHLPHPRPSSQVLPFSVLHLLQGHVPDYFSKAFGPIIVL